MPATEPIQGGPYPEPSDPPDGPNQMSAIAVWAAGRLVMRFSTPAARDAAITSPVEGMVAMTGTGAALREWTYVNGSWRDVTLPTSLPFAMAAGQVYGGNELITIAFPAGRFTVAPILTATADAGGTLSIYTNVTTAGFQWYHGGAYNDTLRWIAVQMTPTSATG